MRAGKLNKRLEILSRSQRQDQETGEITKLWSQVAQVWGSIEPLSGRDFIVAQAENSEITGRITIRWRSGISSGNRIKYGSAIYRVHAALPDPRSGREYLTLMVSEVTGDVGYR